MREYLLDEIIERLRSCPDEAMLDFILKLLIECGY